MHRRAERAEDADPPVADLVAEALDDDRTVVGNGARGLALLVEVLDEVGRRERIERVVVVQALGGALGGEIADLAHERSEGAAELDRPAGTVAVPERHLAGLPRRRGDGDALERDVLDAPCRGPEHERLAGTALVHHLLVELTDPGAVGEEHTEQAAIGDRATARDRETLGSVAGSHGVVDAIPHQPRSQLGELLARIAPGEQVEHVAEQVVGELGEVGAAAHERGEIGNRHVACDRDVGDDLLGQHVERVAQVVGVFDQSVDHAPHDDRRFEQVAAVLREDRAAARFADLVPGTADALQAAAHRSGRLDLDDEIDSTHVDAELERGRGDDAAQLAALELVLDHHPLLACQRAVVRLDQLGIAFAR